MFCPECKAEYRPGFTRCSDCEVDLVEQRPESYLSDSAAPESQMRSVWLCDERDSCVSVCSGLRAAGIPFRVTQHKRQFYWNVDERYEIWVPEELYESAKRIADKGRFDFSDSEEDQEIMELPDAGLRFDKRAAKDRSSCIGEATAEVWSGGADLEGVAWMVEASLHENGIRTHVDLARDGFQRIFVRPEDEFEAREIVREVESGTPPG